MKARGKPVGISIAEKLGWAVALVVALAGGGYVLTRPRGANIPGMPSSAGTAPVRSEAPYQPRPPREPDLPQGCCPHPPLALCAVPPRRAAGPV